jgi:hypothetical protein
LEACAAALLVGAVLEVWAGFQSTSQAGAFSDGAPVGAPTLMQRIVAFALFGGQLRSPFAVMGAAAMLVAGVAVLHRAQPVSNAGVLRWELLVGWFVTLVVLLPTLVAPVVALFGDDPFTSNEPGVVSGYTGPGFVEQLIGALAYPVAALAVLVLAGLWWLRLPADFEESAEDEAARVARAQRPRRMRRPAPLADVDDIVLDGVEYIEPVERLEPRAVRGDGSTTSGYDDYFKRF